MASHVGTRLGSYEILALLGRGGMGEVYRARDTTLRREVAVKLLPEAFCQDAERLARFEREAFLLASLNHPNIGSIYGLEKSTGVLCLVLELVPGKTLAERLASGPIPVEEALRLAAQIAEALEAAHDRGVIHRDLKPGNIKVTPEGRVKVLDFGLAKALSDHCLSSDQSQRPTITGAGSREGLILGTAAYMSPEQTRGQPLDKRTDVWSFGCVLYEMLTGRQAFAGETISDILAAVLDRDPQWETVPAGAPPVIRGLLRRCLRKDLQHRLRDMGDARIEIEEALATPQEPGAARQVSSRARTAGLAAVCLGAVLVGGVAGWMAHAARTTSPTRGPVVVQMERLTHDPSLSEWPSWSPDGTLLAFASNRSGNFEIYVRRIDGGQEVNVTADPSEDYQPSFSPRGDSIAFVSTRSSHTGVIKIGSFGLGRGSRSYGGDVWVAPSLGGRARRLAEDGNFPAWHPDGRRLSYVSGPEDHRAILEVPAEGGAAKPLLASADSLWEIVRIQYSPSGTWMTFETADQHIMLMPAAGGKSRELLRGSCHVWDSSGKRIYYVIENSLGGSRLEAAELNEGDGQLVGAPRTVGVTTGLLRDLSISHDGGRLVADELQESLNLTRLRLDPGIGMPTGPEEPLSSGQIRERFPAFSPDGQRLALASNRLGAQEIWILDLRTRQSERLRLPAIDDDLGANLPMWSHDGQDLAVTRFIADGTASLWLAAVDGSRAEQIVPQRPGLQGGAFSPDGRSLLYSYRSGQYRQIFALDLVSRQERQLTSSASDKYEGTWSPDGKFVIFCFNAAGSLQVGRISASGGQEQSLTSGYERMRHAFYSPNGRWIFAQRSHKNIFRMPAAGGVLEPVTHFPESGLFLEEPTLSPDGRMLIYSRSNGGSSLWMLTIGRD